MANNPVCQFREVRVMARKLLLGLDVEPIRLPQPTAPGITPANFVMLPLGGPAGQTPELASWQQMLYQEAFARAQAVARPSIVERDLAGTWN